MSYMYLIPTGLAFVIGLFYYIISNARDKKMIDRPFLNEWSNDLYYLSFAKPFEWFVNPDEKDPRVKDINKLIMEANESNRLNYRVYITIQMILVMIAIVGFILFSLLANNSVALFQLLFNIKIDANDANTMLQIKIGVGLFLLSFSIMPKYYLSHKAKKNKFKFLKDLPILQLFIILMLKAKRPLYEVVYVLSTTKTIYREIFDTAYRIYIRDKNEGMQYLLDAFAGTKFEETVQVLVDYGEYSKKDTIIILENGLNDITEYTNTMKRRKDIGGNVLSQLSLVIPFLSAMLLIFGPVLAYGLGLMNF